MTPWAFRVYVTEEGRCLINEWYAAQDENVRAEFDVTIAILAQTDDWTEPEIAEFKLLTGRHASPGLGEIRFYVDAVTPGARRPRRRRFRPIGVLRPEQREFVLILGCEKFRMNTVPAGAFDEALRYKTEFDEGRGWTRDYV